ncbi:MAG: hypothetical protein A2W01_11240 [Candidatus Solincola sediminis]|nr:MAG: hypothetical protein A2W01_11240 [Candidatus Solincola sediminis]
MALDYHSINAATNHGLPQATTDIVTSTDKRDVSDMLDLLATADTPFINRIGWGPETGGTKIEWISEDLGPGYVAAGSVKASAGASLQISTCEGLTTAEAAAQLLTGTLLYHYSSTDGAHSLMLVVSTGSDGELEIEVLSTAITFSVATSTIAADPLWIIGAVANEGSLPRTGNWRARVVNSNCFTILRQDVQITGSMKATDMYAIGAEDQHQILMRLKEMQRNREMSALYSVKVTPRSVTEASLMHGALGYLAGTSGSNIDTSTTSLTETAFNAVVGACWEAGAESLTWFSDKEQAAKFTRWDKNRIRMAQSDRKGGGVITSYMTELGIEVEIVPMRRVPTNIALLIATDKCKLRAKKGRKAIMEKLGKAGDFEDWQIITEFSMEMKGYNLHQHGLFTKLT